MSVDFAKASIATDPSPYSFNLVTKARNATIELQLDNPPNVKFKLTPAGSGWQKFNAKILDGIVTDVANALVGIFEPELVQAANQYLGENASYTIQPITQKVEGDTVTVVLSDVKLATENEHLMATATLSFS